VGINEQDIKTLNIEIFIWRMCICLVYIV